jgi:hypothetical protein
MQLEVLRVKGREVVVAVTNGRFALTRGSVSSWVRREGWPVGLDGRRVAQRGWAWRVLVKIMGE